MPEAIWTGSLGFGLVNIPIVLRTAENRKELRFTLLDRRDMAPIGYRKINKTSGKDVPKEEIVKAFKLAEDQYVIVTDADFKRASPERSQKIEIGSFVDAQQVDPAYFERPYYLEPAAKSEKPYVLFRDALKRTRKVGVGTVVIRSHEYLSLVMPRGPALMLELLRFRHELRNMSDLHLPEEGSKKIHISEAEMKMAERLIDDLASPWKPEQFRDRYTDELLAFIEKKAKAGEAQTVAMPEAPKKIEPPADIMALLKESVAHLEESKGRAGRSRYVH